jgi:hypothetical protein
MAKFSNKIEILVKFVIEKKFQKIPNFLGSKNKININTQSMIIMPLP